MTFKCRWDLLVWVGTIGCLMPGISTPADAGRLGSLTCFIVTPISGTKILADTYPVPGISSNVVEITASRGEYEPISIVVRAEDTEVPDISVIPGELVNSLSKSTIAASNLDVRIVKPWFQGHSGWNDILRGSPGDFRQVMVPELLLKNDALVITEANGEKNLIRLFKKGKLRYEQINKKSLAAKNYVPPSLDDFPVTDSRTFQRFSMSARSNKQIWITVHVPIDTNPGIYIGKVQVSSVDELLGDIEVRLRVLPYALQAPRIAYSMYYRGQLGAQHGSIGSEFKTLEQMRSELVDMLDHGVDFPTIYQRHSDRTGIKAALRLRHEAGLSPGPIFYLGLQTTESFLGVPVDRAVLNIQRILPGLLGELRSYGADTVYIYGRDEAKGSDLANQLRLWRAVHDDGGKVFVAGYTGAHDLVGDTLDTFVHFGKPDFREAQRWHTSGGKIFSYANPQTGPENPLLFRLNYGLILWANDYDGAMDYAYQHCFGSCWNDIDHPVYRDHNLTYPTSDGVIPTLAWEGFREGVDDVRYINTLESVIHDLPSNKSVARRDAEAFLSMLKLDIRSRQSRSEKYNRNMGLDLDRIRKEVISRIDELVAK